jgi:Domain of unknown function (DUF6285)
MPNSIPDAVALLETLAGYLENELLPSLEGYHRFKIRVAVNIVNIVRRELALGPAQAQDEQARLAALLGDGADDAALIARIESGALSLDDPALHDHLRRSLAAALAINNPKWIAGGGS